MYHTMAQFFGVNTSSISGAVVLLPFYFELTKGFIVSQSGIALAVMPLAIMIVCPLAGILSDKMDPIVCP